MEEQQEQGSSNKYHCKICKKGFGCGRALGGHMRAHGINDEVVTDEDVVVEPQQPYALRSNPNRLKTNRACENCGKEFWSWKSFLEHGRCEGDDGGNCGGGDGESGDWDVEGSMVSLSRSDGPLATEAGVAWSKGKRSRRAVVVDGHPSDEEDLAASCLVMLSTARVEPAVVTETEESCASASKEEDEDSKKVPLDHRLATTTSSAIIVEELMKPSSRPSRGLFECKACKRVFTSHQALGGHRASHKKVKGCFAAKINSYPEESRSAEEEAVKVDDFNTTKMAVLPFDNTPMAVVPLRKKGKLHECTICHRVFTSGQALGGHKRCHWLTGNTSSPGSTSIAKIQHTNDSNHQLLQFGPLIQITAGPSLDLNLPVTTKPVAAADCLTREVSPAADLCLQNFNVDGSINGTTTTATTVAVGSSCELKDTNHTIGDEGEEKRRVEKAAKLSELKDVGVGGEGSQWLQVGIGSCADVSTDQT